MVGAVVCVATRNVFSEDELARRRSLPEIDQAELIRHFTLTGADEAFVRKFRGKRNMLGAAVQLRTLPRPGFVPGDVAAAPAAAVGRLSQRLSVPMGELGGYGARRAGRSALGAARPALFTGGPGRKSRTGSD